MYNLPSYTHKFALPICTLTTWETFIDQQVADAYRISEIKKLKCALQNLEQNTPVGNPFRFRRLTERKICNKMISDGQRIFQDCLGCISKVQE